MTCRRPISRFRLLSAWFLTLWIFSSIASADIYRWDNGQLIAGTQGLIPRPGIELDSRPLQYAELRSLDLNHASLWQADLSYADLTGADLTGANFRFSILDLAGSGK